MFKKDRLRKAGLVGALAGLLTSGASADRVTIRRAEEYRPPSEVTLQQHKPEDRGSAAARKEAAKQRGLPESSSWRDITDFDSEVARKKAVKERGLPANATWQDITNYDSEKSRKEHARAKGLPENATWREINQAK